MYNQPLQLETIEINDIYINKLFYDSILQIEKLYEKDLYYSYT